ncbi:MAG: M61 family metallopeptidase [Rhizobacter sp.]
MITYRVDVSDLHQHEFQVTLTVQNPQAQQRLSLPVWIPGSYMVREFSRHISRLQAQQGGRTVTLVQQDKATWLATCTGRRPLVLSYRVYAFDNSVRTAFLDAQRGFFNGSSLFLKAHGHESQAHRLELKTLPKGWEVATALVAVKVDARGRGWYEAANYDELIDHPVELGQFWRGRFLAHGVPHDFVVVGHWPDFDCERLLADTKRICESQITFWHGKKKPPFDRYVFLLNAVDEGYGGLEHRNSTALIAARRDLPQLGKPHELSDGYVTLLGLISHEYFHTWNVKRLRPAEFAQYEHSRENYTELLWFFEGFTSYYDDLFLLRAGLIDTPRYLKLLSKTLSTVLATPGRHVQSVAQASFDAWVKYYRQDENSVNATISYYTKGSLIALAMDLLLRCGKQGTLDDVMRLLWKQSSGGPVSETDIQQAFSEVSGIDALTALQTWVHGTEDPPWQALLGRLGIAWKTEAPSLALRLGVKVSESALTGIKVTQVLRGGVAETCGMAVGDELLALNGWRLRRLDDAQRLLNVPPVSTLLVCRDQKVFGLSLRAVPSQEEVQGAVQLAEAPLAPPAVALQRKAWLAP